MKPDKRELILQAAAQVFGEKGFHTATVEEIAKRAGVGKGTIYQYFDSKEEIFNELHQWFIQRYLQALDILDEDAPFLVSVQQIIAIHTAHVQEYAPIAAKLHQEMLDMHVDTCQAHDALQQLEYRFDTLVRRAIERGELKDIEPQLAVIFIEGVFAALTRAALLKPGDQEAMIQQMMELIMTGLGR